ncbi:PH domain-containing protein [uncultured Secundilactobacillus sp.]|uniref:PH domain-containing protein n=1 Tax=uncultured Secundilactobacillus sp. TaxID=2813935 RepID=UPI00258DC93C|nr:PH domain-containing protein [uncultured Secundilactobacillus sp.]
MTKMPKQRLHPLILVTYFLSSLVNWFVICFVVMNFHFIKDIPLPQLLGLAATIATATSFAKYWLFTFEVGDQALTINSGLLFRQQRHIPYDRIQTLQTKRWFYMIPFGLKAVVIETAGKSGDDGDAQLPMVKDAVYQELLQRQHFAAAKPEVPSVSLATGEASQAASYKINSRDLNEYALTSLGLAPVILALIYGYTKISDLVPKPWLSLAVSSVQHAEWLLLAMLVLGLLILGTILSYLQLMIRYYGFTVTRQHRQLLTERGLFQRRTVTSDLDRVQAIVVKQSVLRQLFQLATVQTVLASTLSDDEESEMVVMPVLRTDQVWTVMPQFLPWLPTSQPVITAIPWLGQWRMIRNAVAVAMIPVVGWVIVARATAGWSLLLPVIALFLGRYAGQHTGIGLVADYLVAQEGSLFSRTLTLVPKKRIQAATIPQSIWMKRVGLAHLAVSVRSGDAEKKVTVRYLPLQVARQYYEWYRA